MNSSPLPNPAVLLQEAFYSAEGMRCVTWALGHKDVGIHIQCDGNSRILELKPAEMDGYFIAIEPEGRPGDRSAYCLDSKSSVPGLPPDTSPTVFPAHLGWFPPTSFGARLRGSATLERARSLMSSLSGPSAWKAQRHRS